MKKYIYGMLIALLGVGTFTACSDDDDNYQWATVSGQQVYFSNQLATTYEVATDQNSFSIPIRRVATGQETTVPLKVTTSEGTIFSVPTSVTFADTASVASILVTYDPALIEYGKYDTVTVAIDNAELVTPYGASSYTFYAGATAWVEMGTGQYRDGLVSGLYGLDAQVYNVKIMKNVVQEGLYRVIDPYGAGTPFASFFDGTGLNTVLEIDATDPDFVWFSAFDSGVTMNEADGELSFLSFVEYYLNRGNALDAVKAGVPQYFGKLQDGIITISTPSSCLATIGGEGYYYANQKGLFAVALPGHVIRDYALAFSQTGRFISVSNEERITGTITVGEDVESVKYALVSASEDAEAVVAGIIDGTVEAQTSEGGDIQLPAVPSGNYMLYVVAFAEGEAVAQEAYPVVFNSQFETWTPVARGIYYYTYYDLTADDDGENGYGGVFDALGNVPGTLYVSNDDESRYKIAPWALAGDDGLVMTADEEGGISVFYNYSGLTDEDYGAIYATDVQSYGLANIASSLNNGVFYLYLAYHNDEDWLGAVLDAFQITELLDDDEAEARRQSAPLRVAAKMARPARPHLNLPRKGMALRQQARLDALK